RESLSVVVVDPMPQERRDALRAGLLATLADVAAAVGDPTVMNAAMAGAIDHLRAGPAGVDPALVAESVAFLEWLNADHFVFLGARDYDYPRD
ncbi:NAD-glutamate dehydrogenase, partial [Klebsiella pneumoniae]|uniref:NAD-glutamate dehydrogenase domain-containing protein n=1 Tax=Klebsiella pneumoniae TaxID=573 RepID=UPI002108A43F